MANNNSNTAALVDSSSLSCLGLCQQSKQSIHPSTRDSLPQQQRTHERTNEMLQRKQNGLFGGGRRTVNSSLSSKARHSSTISRLVVGLALGTPLLLLAMLLWMGHVLVVHPPPPKPGISNSGVHDETAPHPPKDDANDDGAVKYHIVFSTGCSAFQDWQSYVFFFQALKVQQPGIVTRIVSGCDAKEEEQLRQIFAEQVAPMSSNFRIHFTPDYAKILKPGIDYPYFNKPCGMVDWLENVLGFPNHAPLAEQDAIVVLLDPDQLILRPFVDNDFSNTEWLNLDPSQPVRTKIAHGEPMGQRYGFALQWKTKIDMSLVAPADELPSPVDDMSSQDAMAGYVVGPPYIATARDMYAICDKWCAFAPRVHDQYPHLLAEMFAYCLAAAHLKLSHQTAASFMVSSTGSGKQEGWPYIDRLPDEHICQPSQLDPQALPSVLHFCQRYGWGPYFFGKRKLPHSFLSCEHALLADPPATLLQDYTTAEFPNNNVREFSPEDAKRNTFVVCYMIATLNEAAAYYKANHCTENAKTNSEHSMILSQI
jgi:hypothetical protein